MALEDSQIDSVKDWEGKTFGYKISLPSDYMAMMESEGVARERIQEVSVGFDPRILTEGKVDVLAVFKSNEPDTIRSLGYDVTVWDPYEYGVPTLGLTYITTQDYADTIFVALLSYNIGLLHDQVTGKEFFKSNGKYDSFQRYG